MKYELVLQDKKIVLTKEEADIVTKGLLEKQELFRVNENVFKRTAIKGIFPIANDITDNGAAWKAQNKNWIDFCLKMSLKGVDEKTDIELTNRIFPGLMLNKITLPEPLVDVMQANIRMFFEANKKYPRCPMRVWWPFIAETVAPLNVKTNKRNSSHLRMNKWWDYVLRNDEAVAQWIKYAN